VTYDLRGARMLQKTKAGEEIRRARLPHLKPMLLLAGQISAHSFCLAWWVERHGGVAYVKMLADLATLVNSNKVIMELHVLDCSGGMTAMLPALHECMRVVRGDGVGEKGAEFCARPQLVLQLGTIAQADELYFELADAMKRLNENILTDAPASSGSVPAQTLEEFMEALGLAQYVPGLQERGLGLGELRGSGRDARCTSAWSVDDLRASLVEAGVKKVGHREKLIRSLLGGEV
jgi:hypothetical protein